MTEVSGVAVAIVEDAAPQREILLFMGMRASIGAAEMQRCRLLAELWKARVTVTDIPGCGTGSARLTSRDRRSLYRGDFRSLARRMVCSAQMANPALRRDGATLVGYSLGASLAAAAAADAGLIRVRQLTAVEPVAIKHWNVIRLLRTVRSESGSAIEHHEHSSMMDLARLGHGISRGRLPTEIVSAHRFQRFPVQVIHGRDSRLCDRTDAERVVSFWRRHGIDASKLTVPGNHGLWHSSTEVGAMARLAGAQWPQTPRVGFS